MKNPERLIGRKVYGFKFEDMKKCEFPTAMNKYVGKIGIIKELGLIYKIAFKVEFEDKESFYYPADQIEAHLVEDEMFTFNANHNKMKLEDEIPTLSDGVMMLVSDDKTTWNKHIVFGFKNGFYFAWYNENRIIASSFKHAKPIEPTKEEQLTAILGSSEKVSEIMELFKKE